MHREHTLGQSARTEDGQLGWYVAPSYGSDNATGGVHDVGR